MSSEDDSKPVKDIDWFRNEKKRKRGIKVTDEEDIVEVPYYIAWGIPIFKSRSNFWSVLNSYETKIVTEIAILNPEALTIFYRFKKSLKKYEKRYERDLLLDWRARTIVLTLLHNLGSYTRTNFVEKILEFSILLASKETPLTVPRRADWENLTHLPLKRKLEQAVALFNRYWYSENNELYQNIFNEKKWRRFWRAIPDTPYLSFFKRQKKVTKPIIFLCIWWTIHPVSTPYDKHMKLRRPNFDHLKTFQRDCTLIPSNSAPETLLDDEIFANIMKSLRMDGFRGVTAIADAHEEKWSLSSTVKIDLKRVLVEWLEEWV